MDRSPWRLRRLGECADGYVRLAIFTLIIEGRLAFNTAGKPIGADTEIVLGGSARPLTEESAVESRKLLRDAINSTVIPATVGKTLFTRAVVKPTTMVGLPPPPQPKLINTAPRPTPTLNSLKAEYRAEHLRRVRAMEIWDQIEEEHREPKSGAGARAFRPKGRIELRVQTLLEKLEKKLARRGKLEYLLLPEKVPPRTLRDWRRCAHRSALHEGPE